MFLNQFSLFIIIIIIISPHSYCFFNFINNSNYAEVDESWWDEEFGADRRKRKRTEKGDRVPRAKRGLATAHDRFKLLPVQLSDRFGNQYLIKRKVRFVDPSLPTYTRIPPDPIPLSWVHTISPYRKTIAHPGCK